MAKYIVEIPDEIETSKDSQLVPFDMCRPSWWEEAYNKGKADAEPERKTGRWLLRKGGSGTCSKCRHTQIAIWDADNWQNFCGVCGARMVGVEI